MWSWGLLSSIKKVSSKSDWKIGGRWMEQRNHHEHGNSQIMEFINKMFDIPESFVSGNGFDDFVYLSQIYQALCISSEASFYKSRAGINGTMGSLYWQLNDVWTTASWSSIDYSKKWK